MAPPPTIEVAVELTLLGLLAIKATRVLLRPAFIRELRAHPLLLSIAVIAGVAAMVVGAPTFIASPPALRALTGIALLVWIGLAWRGRTNYGISRGLPPGSLSLTSSLNAVIDRSFYLREIERHGPIFKTAQFHRPVVCVLGLAQGRELLQQYGEELSAPLLAVSRLIPKGFLRYMAPVDYQHYAPLFRAAFDETAVSANLAFARQRAREQLEDLSARSHATPGGVHPRGAIDAFLSEALVRVFFGSLLTTGDHEVVKNCMHESRHVDALGRASARSRHALERFSSLLRNRNAATETAGQCVWSRLSDLRPESPEDETVLGNLLLMLAAAHDSIGNLLIWMFKLVGENQTWASALRAELAQTDNESRHGASRDDLAARIVTETLRLSTSEYIYRRIDEPIEIGGFSIPQGWMLRVLVAESHLLDPPFEHPLEFDPDRHLNRSYTSTEFSPWGLDHHACLAAWLSLALGRLFIEEQSRFDCTITADGPAERGNRHWMHWIPSSQLRAFMAHPDDRGTADRLGLRSPSRPKQPQ